MNSETFLWNNPPPQKKNQKKERKILKFKELCFQDTLSDKFQQIVQKLWHFIFSIPFFIVSFV